MLNVDALRAKAHSPLAEVWLHGKLLYALMLERRMRRQLGDSWGRLDRERVGTWWRVWGMLKDEIVRDCSESTGLPPEDVYRTVRV